LRALGRGIVAETIALAPAAASRGSPESEARENLAGDQELADRESNDRNESALSPIDLSDFADMPWLKAFVASIPAERSIPANMVYIRVSRALLSRDLPKQISYEGKVEENVLATPVTGTARTTAQP
jgi:hypothetical protein